jgi:hypothetical protein
MCPKRPSRLKQVDRALPYYDRSLAKFQHAATSRTRDWKGGENASSFGAELNSKNRSTETTHPWRERSITLCRRGEGAEALV